MGRGLHFLSGKVFIILLAALFLMGLYSSYFAAHIPGNVLEFMPHIFSLVGLMLILKAFAERGDARGAWLFVMAGQLFITLSIALLNQKFGYIEILIYLSGSIISGIVGFICLQKIKAIDDTIDLNQFHGYVYEQPLLGLIFLISCFGLVGLPFTPTFIGIDLLFSHIHKHEGLLIVFTALSFVVIEVAILRIYARVFIGQHKKTYHAMAYRSS